MTTLKSFELKGNKLSFANFISNLSPCDTPFTSMIGKEVIDQTQYSWQTDSLAPASNLAIEEGSQAAFQTRASTQIITNFTSTLRTVASVSDTVKQLGLYGRNKEVGYQIGKAGKEILRDLEFMSLHNLNGLPGSKNTASTFAGFEGLVAGLNVADTDTKAVVHKSVQISGVNFDKEDLFDLTMNLYLAGSKADKIMFHPKFASSFSDLISNDVNSPQIYRMFDGMDSKFNVQVKTIKDSLGKIWTLIPNRFMPVDKFYFFHESDWTQTVLRTPATTKLAKKGSSDQYMVEMEVGLRHRHPYASGILSLSTVNIHNTFDPIRSRFTAATGDVESATCNITVDGVAEENLDVHWFSDDECISFKDLVTKTAVNGTATNEIIAGNRPGAASIWTVCRGVKSGQHLVTVGAPRLTFAVSKQNPDVGEIVDLEVAVIKVDGAPVKDGTTIKWYVSPSSHLELTAISNETVAGVAKGSGRVLKKLETVVQATLGNFTSNLDVLNYVPKPEIIEVNATPNTFLENGSVDGFAQVTDSLGNPLAGVTVTWSVEPQRLASFTPATSTTDGNGIAECKLTGQNKGQGKLKAVTVGAIQISGEGDIFVGMGAIMDFTINPNPTTVGVETEFRIELTGQDGIPLSDVPVTVVADMGGELNLNGTTDVFGTYSDRVTFTTNSDLEATATATGFDLSKVVTLTFDDTTVSGAPTLEVVVNPATGSIGNPTTATVTYKDGLGAPKVGSNIRFLTVPTWADSTTPDLVTDENGNASLNFTAIRPGDYKVRAHVTGSNPVIESDAVDMKFV